MHQNSYQETVANITKPKEAECQLQKDLSKIKTNNFDRKTLQKMKAEKLGFNESTKIKCTSHEIIMTSFLSIGMKAEKDIKKKLKFNKNEKKINKNEKKNENKLTQIAKLEIYRGLENLFDLPSNIIQSCMNGSKCSKDFFDSLD